VTTFVQDLRIALRSFLKQRAFTTAALLSLALGLGANTTIFTLINAAFLTPLPVKDVDRLVAVYTTDVSHPGYLPVSYLNFEDFRDHNEVVSKLVAVQWLMVSLTGGDAPERAFCQIVSGSYFDVLKVRASRGHTFLPEDDSAPGRNPVAVISHGLWQRRFGGDPNLVGRKVSINNHAFTIIGITPEGFKGTDRLTAIDVWIPMSMYEQISNFRAMFKDRSGQMFNMIGRLKPGVTVQQADTAFRLLAARQEQAYPDTNKGWGAAVLPIEKAALDPNDRQIYARGGMFLSLVVGLLLLITCANLASLLLARATTREREMAIRVAVGAHRGHLIRQLRIESLMLALAGGALSLLVAFWSGRILWRLRPPFLTDDTPLILGIDARILGFTLLISLLTGLLFGLIPALQASRPNPSAALSAAPRSRTGKRRFGLRDILVIGQIALALVALIGAGLFLVSLRNVQREDPGFAVDKLLVMSMDLGGQGYDPERGRALYHQILERVEALPGVVSATLSPHRPLSRVGLLLPVTAEGQEHTGPGTPVRADTAGPKYFSTVGIPILRGRDFTDSDRQDTPRVAIVNETMARQFWPGQDALNRRFILGTPQAPSIEIVGIARSSKYVDVSEPPQPYFYRPFSQNYVPTMTLYVRTEGNPATLLPAVRHEVQALAPNLPLTDVQTVADRLSGSLWAPRLGSVLLGAYGLLAFILAATGIYGLMAYSVAQRRREIGIRMALGARRSDVLHMVLVHGLGIISVGLTLGISAALAGSRFVASMLFGISPSHLPTILGMAILFAAVALLASFIPAYRATRLNVVRALRPD
jgi:macrolide transport system ATP-binding/permease protein